MQTTQQCCHAANSSCTSKSFASKRSGKAVDVSSKCVKYLTRLSFMKLFLLVVSNHRTTTSSKFVSHGLISKGVASPSNVTEISTSLTESCAGGADCNVSRS